MSSNVHAGPSTLLQRPSSKDEALSKRYGHIVLITTFTASVIVSFMSLMRDVSNERKNPMFTENGAYTAYSTGMAVGLIAVGFNLGIAALAGVNSALALVDLDERSIRSRKSIARKGLTISAVTNPFLPYSGDIIQSARRVPSDDTENEQDKEEEEPMVPKNWTRSLDTLRAQETFCVIAQYLAGLLAGGSLILLTLDLSKYISIIAGIIYVSCGFATLYNLFTQRFERFREIFRQKYLPILPIVLSCVVSIGTVVTTCVPVNKCTWLAAVACVFTILHHFTTLLSKPLSVHTHAVAIAFLFVAWAGTEAQVILWLRGKMRWVCSIFIVAELSLLVVLAIQLRRVAHPTVSRAKAPPTAADP